MLKGAFFVVVFGLLLWQWQVLLPKKWHEAKFGDIQEFLEAHGYPLEAHQVQTDDGYILTIHRIPHGTNRNGTVPSKRPPVFLMHGLLLSSMDWVILGPNRSIGCILADAGYDVWLGNNRGNTYSKKHIELDPNEHKKHFFNYSYHEIGIYDLPAIIDYIIDTTGYNQLTYIGFSEGVTSFFVMASLKPKYNEKILMMNAFAAVTDTYNVSSIYFNLLANYPSLLNLDYLLGWYEWFDVSSGPLIRLLCHIRPLCNIFFDSIGLSLEQRSGEQDFQLSLLSSFPAGMSWKQACHYVQGTRTGMFAPFQANGTTSSTNPVEPYNLSKVTAPIIIYYSDADNLVNKHALLTSTSKQLPNIIKLYEVPYRNFDHMDFLWGQNIGKLTEETLNNINRFNNV